MHYENQILDAIETIVDSKIKNAGYDKTIQATIVSCEDATIGKYKVNYQDSSFYAYANSSEISYANGAEVYILIPNGDMSQDKTILGSTKKLGKDYATAAQGEEAFEIVGTNCIDSNATFELCSYETTLAKIIYDRNAEENLLNLNIKNLEEYIKESTSITLAATIKTSLPTEQQFRGNYGIVYQMVFDDNATGEEVTRNYILDINQFEGNPYNFINYKRQFGIFEVDGKNFKYVNKVYLFCYDFPNQGVGEKADIFIKNLELYGTVALTEEDLNAFKLSFITKQGTFFDNNDTEKATRLIEAKVRVKGKYIDPTSQQLPYYWFVENNGITSLSEDYCSYGGQGWKCLNKKNIIKSGDVETAPIVEWVPGSYQYTVTKGDNQAKETKYKCVVLYNNMTLSREITITNYSSQWNITINSDSGTEFYYDIGNPSLTCFVNGNEEIGNEYTYQWAEVNSKGDFYSLPDTIEDNQEYEDAVVGYKSLEAQIQAERAMAAASQAQLNEYLQTMKKYDTIRRVDKNKIYHLQVNTITAFTTYKCSVYYNGIYIGTSSIVLRNRLDKKDLYTLVINNGVQTFKYDEQGVAPTSQALENPQTIPALSFSIYDNLGNQLSEDVIRKCKIKWSIPIENTLIVIPSSYRSEDEEIENGYLILKDLLEINYEIQQKYNVSKTNNNIQLLVTYKDMNLITRTDLTFAKEGEPGTNGTEFLCKIVPNTNQTNFGYPMLTNGVLNYIPINSNRWFKAQLWHSGEKIYDGYLNGISTENKNVTIKWEILKNKYSASISDVSSIAVTEQGSFSYIGYQAEFNSPADIIKCTIRYEGVDYYCTLPLITAKAETGYAVELIENTGFRFATYSSDGRTPQFDNSTPFTLKVTDQINGYIEDVSTLQENNGVIYNWQIKGVIYDKATNTFINKINLGSYNRSDSTIAYNQASYKPLEDYDGESVTNALECAIEDKNNNIVARINIPIHLLLNKYGHAEINGWDGNHVSIDENGSGVILAPQVGAGQKEQDNSFTGLLMGKVKEATHRKQYIGLHGYNHGIRTIFLNAENGSALFGKQGVGQIIIDPTINKGLLYSYNFWSNYGEDGLPISYNENNETKAGMLIDLSTPGIRFGSGYFKVDSTGYTTMKFAEIGDHTQNDNTKGPIYIGKSGDGFSAIYTGTKNKKNISEDGFYIGVNGFSLGQRTTYTNYDGNTVSACKFQVDADGTLYAMDGTFNGRIVSDRGKIGGWEIREGKIGAYDSTTGNPLVELESDGRIKVGSQYTEQTTIIDGWGVDTGWINYGLYEGVEPIDLEDPTVRNVNISGFAYGNDGTGPRSTEVLALSSSWYSVVLHSRSENIRLTAGKNIYLDVPDGTIFFKSQITEGEWMELGSSYAKFG